MVSKEKNALAYLRKKLEQIKRGGAEITPFVVQSQTRAVMLEYNLGITNYDRICKFLLTEYCSG